MNTLIPLFSAIVTGAVGLIAGIAIPILLDPTTVQGPLLGILGTGPLGVALGGHAGVVWAARRRGRVAATDFFWLGLFAAVILLMNEWFVAVLSARFIVLPAAFLITGMTAVVLVRHTSISRTQRRVLVALSIVAALFFFTTMFPPVTRNPYFTRAEAPAAPRFAFLGAREMDTRSRVPPWRVDGPFLHLEWLVCVVLGASIGQMFRRKDGATSG